MTPCASCGIMAVHWVYHWGKDAHGVEPLFAVNLCADCAKAVGEVIIRAVNAGL